MKKRKKWPLVLALWMIFIVLVMGVAYLSFQNGESAKALGKGVITQLAQAQYSEETLMQEDLDHFTYLIRQSGRVLAFLMIGIVGTITIHVTFIKSNWLVRTGVTMMILVAIAYLTEKLKIFIPSRHYSHEEMLISIYAVIVGFVFVSAVTFVFKAMKGLFRIASR